MQSLTAIWQQLPGAADAGLTTEAVHVSRSRFGPNRLTPLAREPLWKKFLEKFDEPIIRILLAAALLSMFVDLFGVSPVLATVALTLVGLAVAGLYAIGRKDWAPTFVFLSGFVLFLLGLALGHALVEGMAVMVAVGLATGVAFFSEYKSDREFELLNARKDEVQVKVLRDGAFRTVPMEDLVIGDVVILEMGDEIPADGRLVKATDLLVDQSLMTGESESVQKRPQPADAMEEGPDQPGCLYRGTQVVDGVGQFVVTAVGDATYLGQIARRLAATEEAPADNSRASEEDRIKRKLTISKELTPLQLKLQHLAELISKVGYFAAGAIFLTLLIRGIWLTRPAEIFWPVSTAQAVQVGGNLLSYFVYMVIIIVVAVPEGLPMSVTVSLALAMRKMTRANSLVRQLVACETIGSATVICSDKTGTLTQNKMKVAHAFWDGTTRLRGTDDCRLPVPCNPANGPIGPSHWIALNAAINSTANLEQRQGRLTPVGNSTEGSLLLWLEESGLQYQTLRLEHPPLYQVHFSSERKRMTSVIRLNGRLVVLAKGAPEWILAQCDSYLGTDGIARPWTAQSRAAVETALHDAAGQAMRTLAFAHAELPADQSDDGENLHACRDSLETGLIFTGLVAIRDPLRDDVRAAVDQCRAAGIEVKMITGDNVETARAIAFDAGLIDRRDAEIDTPDAAVLTSATFHIWHDRLMELRSQPAPSPSETTEAIELCDRIARLRVLARARPLDKYLMVQLLQERGEVVAVTGDGTNDAPALKKADVGLAMGIAGTEVAKEASKIVLLDDAFSTIVKAVHWGRSLYENIQRFIQFQLTINVSALTIAFLGPFFGVRPPFTVLQLLWINVIMDTLASIALCSEPPRPGLLDVPPKRKDENILTPAMIGTIFSTATFFVIVMLTLLLGMEHAGWFAADSRPDPDDWDFAPLNVRQVTIFFTLYVFFQVWNQVNCRSLVPSESGFRRLFHNPTFLIIAALVALGQVIIVSIPGLGTVFKVAPLAMRDWIGILVGSASVLLFAEAARRLRMRAGSSLQSVQPRTAP